MTNDRQEIFTRLKEILCKYSPPLIPTSDDERRYELVAKKDVEFKGRKFHETYFGAAIIQSTYVGLYLMHVYNKPEMLKEVPEELRKCLKGKSCFHIKHLDGELLEQIKKTVKHGFDRYKINKMV